MSDRQNGQHPVQDTVRVTMEEIRSMVDANTIIGTPITCEGGTTVIPISKVSFGFASGGSDLPTKVAKDMFGGGGGAGVTVTPVAFLVITGSDVKLMQLSINAKAANAVVNMVPDLMDKLTGFLNQKQQEKLKASEKNAQTED
ncbi:MAG: GerW family sporulation protein [Oscillospiraceae bacterium]|nr:GerW family sporulation protein [Oscillospiraceae bacterium]